MVEGRCRNRIYHQVTKDFFKAAFDGLCCISFNIRDTRKKAEDVATTAGEGSLETTPTWAVATLCFSLILISTLIEHGLHLLAKYFHRKRRRALNQALNKIKSELMLLGFISLLLTMIEKPIATICIPQGAGEIFLPCKKVNSTIDFEEETKCEKLVCPSFPIVSFCVSTIHSNLDHIKLSCYRSNSCSVNNTPPSC